MLLRLNYELLQMPCLLFIQLSKLVYVHLSRRACDLNEESLGLGFQLFRRETPIMAFSLEPCNYHLMD